MKVLSLIFVNLLFLSCSTTKLENTERQVSSLNSSNTNYSILYKKLNIDEYALPASRIVLRYQKVVGPLSCQKTINLHQNEIVDCKINNKEGTHQQIYDSLSIKELSIPSNRMTLKYIKKGEGISCTKNSTIDKSPTYHCLLLPAHQYKCLPYKEMCRASFCTGGHKMIDLSNNEVVEYFRHYDYGENTLGYCQSFL